LLIASYLCLLDDVDDREKNQAVNVEESSDLLFLGMRRITQTGATTTKRNFCLLKV
jgi:hypothetical protein